MSELSQSSKCRICGTIFPEGVPIIGETPEQKIQRIAQPMMIHLEQSHPQALSEVVMMSAMSQAVLALNLFECNDPQVNAVIQQRRDTVLKYVAGNVSQSATN